VSATLFPRLRSGHALLTFFLIAEKESKIGFPLLFPQKAVNFLLAVQKKVNMRFFFLVVQKESVKGKIFKGDICGCRL